MVALVLALGGGAYAATATGGHRIESAVVTAKGKLVRGKGAIGAERLRSHGKVVPGAYEVLFFDGVRNCSYKATLGNADGLVPAVGQASVAKMQGIVNGVHVVTTNWNGVSKAEGFHLVVVC
jgi:hypothetical protein